MIYLWVRETTEWDNEAVVLKQLRNNFRPKVDVWNDVFRTPYHIFRHRIKQIAQLNLSRVENAVCATMRDIPDGAVVVPVDDDDWLSPQLGNVLEAERQQGKSGYYWRRAFLELPPTLIIKLGRFVLYDCADRKRKVWTCSTNNYALVKCDKFLPLLKSHEEASAYFDGEKENLRWIDKHLSIMNRTLASQTSLAWKKPRISKRELIRKFHRYKGVYSGIRAEELAWCNPYVSMMADLIGELRLK